MNIYRQWATTAFLFHMNIEFLRKLCSSLPGTSEDVKWGNDLCFLVGKKMFCVTGLGGEGGVSFKVSDEEFEELIQKDGIIPAPYMARNKWVNVSSAKSLTKKDWEHFIKQSYELVAAKLTKKEKKDAGIV